MTEIFRVFLSSTGKDLGSHRDQVFTTLQRKDDVKVIRQEDFKADDDSPKLVCEQAVEACEIFVCLIAFRYGSSPPGRVLSHTQLEYEAARDLPRLVFVAPEGTLLPQAKAEGDEITARLERFREKVLKTHTAGHADAWASAEILASHVSDAVEGELKRLRALREPTFTKGKHEAQLQTRLASLMNEIAEEATETLLKEKAVLEGKLQSLDVSFKEAQQKIAELEALLNRSGNEIGGDRLNDATEKLEAGDLSAAAEIFEEIRERQKLHVQEAARAEFGLGKIAEQEVRWQDAQEHFERAAALDPTTDHLNMASQIAWKLGDFAAAEALARKGLRKAEAEEDEEDRALWLGNLGLYVQLQGRFEEVEPFFRQALKIDEATLRTGHPDYAIRLNNLANLLQDMGRYEEAEPLLRQALEIDEATLRTGHPDYAIRLNNLANLLQDMGRYEEAEPLLRQALEIGEATIGTGHPDYATRLNNLALLLRDMGRFEEAEPLFRQAMEIGEATIGTGHPDYATRLNNLALLLRDMGRYDEAEPLYRQAMEIDEATLGTGHPHYAIRLNNLALLLRDTDRFEEAEPLFRQALEIDEATIGTGHPAYAIHLNNLAILVEYRGRLDEAEALYRQAMQTTRDALGEMHPSYANRIYNLADLLAKVGKEDEAKPLFDQAVAIAHDRLGSDHPTTQLYVRARDGFSAGQ